MSLSDLGAHLADALLFACITSSMASRMARHRNRSVRAWSHLGFWLAPTIIIIWLLPPLRRTR